ncbi:MAG: S-formylglutathione hydrolase [Glaciecola sp.]
MTELNEAQYDVTQVSSTKVFGGLHQQYTHISKVTNCQMRFAVYLPPQAQQQEVPVVYWLSGLTCTDENFMQKAGALKIAADLGIAIVAPDTSPRGEGVADDPDGAYDMGLGAGFYINATQAPWSTHYQMYDYIVKELFELIETTFNVSSKRAISGHSMGGHGALTIGLKHPNMFSSISAFSPICNPVACAWGQKVFSHYLGDNTQAWLQYDACELIKQGAKQRPMLIEQGTADGFLEEQLKTENLLKQARESGYSLQVNMREGYDHSYYFISSFIDEHMRFHAEHLQK